MPRAEFIAHAGHRILRFNFGGLAPEDFLAEYPRAMRLLTAEPPRSVRLLTIPTSQFDERMASAIRQWAPMKAKHVWAEALVAATSIHKLLFLGNKAKYQLDREVFDDEAAAKEWLGSR